MLILPKSTLASVRRAIRTRKPEAIQAGNAWHIATIDRIQHTSTLDHVTEKRTPDVRNHGFRLK